MNEKAYYLSLEAIISLSMLGLLLAMQVQPKEASLLDLHVFKKENDLLLLWAKKWPLEEGQAIQDFEFAFPGKSGEIIIDGKKIPLGAHGKEGIASRAIFFNGFGARHEIALVVFKQNLS